MIAAPIKIGRATQVKAFAPKARVARMSGMKVCAQTYKVTLETPSGTETIDCDADTYILDAAEVRSRASAVVGSRPWPSATPGEGAAPPHTGGVRRCGGLVGASGALVKRRPLTPSSCAGRWHRHPVLVPRGRLLVVRRQDYGAPGPHTKLVAACARPPRCLASSVATPARSPTRPAPLNLACARQPVWRASQRPQRRNYR